MKRSHHRDHAGGTEDGANVHRSQQGLYIHIPFCARRCPYCDFAIRVGSSAEFEQLYVEMLRRELSSCLPQFSRASHSGLTSIFFGGGTPTSLSPSSLAALMDLIRDSAPVEAGAEVSIEANPDGLRSEDLRLLRAAGFNRISFGMQSLDQGVLDQLGRTHDAQRASAVFAEARKAGFDNINIDLIYAVPGQDRASWQSTLLSAMELQPDHLSCYSLTIEEGTPFAAEVRRGNMVPFDSDSQYGYMQDAESLLGASGVERYEVSNYARRGFECRHNLNYWHGGNYIGCGNSAHGHESGHRWWNLRSAQAYVRALSCGASSRAGEESLTPRQRASELILLGLRLRAGFTFTEVSTRSGLDARGWIGSSLHAMQDSGLVEVQGDHVRMAPQQLALADAVAERLIPDRID